MNEQRHRQTRPLSSTSILLLTDLSVFFLRLYVNSETGEFSRRFVYTVTEFLIPSDDALTDFEM